jgi:hypothetical protein
LLDPRQLIRRVVNELEHDGMIKKDANPHRQRASLLVST